MLAGCVRVYQPLSGLHNPYVVNPQLPNFADVALTVRCIPGGYLSGEENSVLCQNVGRLFENQGATVTVLESLVDADAFGAEEPEEAEDGAEEAPTDLVLELRSRRVHRRVNWLSWGLSLGTLTVLPATEEHTFATDITIRDATGFQLVSDTMRGRLLTRNGVGPWLFNAIANLGRDKEDRLTFSNAQRDLSTDLYRQLSQRLFDAKLQWVVLQESNVERSP